MGTTTNLKLPFPELSDQADANVAVGGLATATESYFYNRTLPSGVVRAPSYFWGSGTAFPTTGMVAGDTYRHTTLGLHVYNGSAWEQTAPLKISSMTARPANNTPGLYGGFKVTPLDMIQTTWTWNTITWIPDNWPLSTYFGANPPAGCFFRADGGSAVLTTNGIGAFNIGVSTATQIFAAEMVPGDNAGYLGYIVPIPVNYTTNTIQGQAFANGIGQRDGIYGPGGTTANMQIRVNWKTYSWTA